MVDGEVTITSAKTLDIDNLMSDKFDINTYFGSEKSAQLDLVSQHIDKNELVNDIKMTAFLQNIGVIGKDNIEANRLSAYSLFNQNTSSGLWDSIKEGWRNNKLQMEIADIRIAEMRNQINPAQAQEQVDILKKRIKETTTTGFSSWMRSVANLAPMMIESAASGAKWGLTGGLMGAGIVATAGEVPPFTVLPEEAITVPVGFALGARIGGIYGMLKRTQELEAGLMYDELLSMTDEQGNKIDPLIAKPISESLGIINAFWELAQVKDIISTIPGGKKLLRKAQENTIRNLLKSKSLLKVIGKGAVRYGGHVGFETGTEVIQEADNIIMGEFAKNISNQLAGTDIKPAEIGEITNRLIETAKESAKGFSIIAGPGNLIQTLVEVPEVAPKIPETGVIEQVKRISKIMPAEKVVSRIDMAQFGKTMVEEGAEMPTKKPREVVPKEVVLTPEEEYQLQQSEATLKAEEPFTISPRLYIGNVTQRMKKVWGEALGVDPDTVHGFLEGAFPTIRTKIELTMGEARHLLIHIENSLQKRLDENQIHTHNDLARANADWGDIKSLRKALGLPEVQRPFKVIRDAKTEVITIENIKERISKAVQPSKLDTTMLSQVDRLNQVMRRVAKAAKEGWKGGKAEAKKAYAELQYLRKQRELRNNLIDKIQKEPSEKIDFFYREAIKGIQNAIDFGAKTEEGLQKKEIIKKLLKDNPDKANEIPQDILDTLDKKDLSTLSYTDLLTINEEIKRLNQLGKLKSELYNKQRTRAIKSEIKSMVQSIEKAPKNILPNVERANTLRPSRIFDMLDGGKKFLGRIYNFFYQATNENYNAELQNSDSRQTIMRQRLEELGLTLRSLTKKRIVGDIKFTVDELLSIYAGWKNPESQMVLRYGGLEINSQKEPVLIDDNLYNKVVESLTEKEKVWGDTIIKEYEEHYQRMRTTVIRAENRDPGRSENYTPIRHTNIKYTSTEQEVLDELALRHFFSQVGPHKAFTLPRIEIPPEYQKPMRSGLTKIWMQEVRKQEHYINNAMHLKDMRAISKSDNFRNVVIQRFGEPMIKAIDHYVDMMANPDYYKTFNDIENASKFLRRNTAIAYIAFNVSSYMNQFPSIMLYWAHSSFVDVLVSTLDSAFHPMNTYEKAKNIHYQISHQSIEREMVELQRADSNAYKKIINTVGRAGMYGIFAIDRAIRVIGINAVYNKAIRDGLSPNEAARKASTVTLLTQESASPKDLARIYSTSEFLNWFTMFTNQLNQIYNITTYDIPVAIRNKNYQEATRSAIAIGVMAMLFWSIQSGEIPDEPDDAAAALAEEFVSSIPIFGNAIVAGAKGWSSTTPPPLRAAIGIGGFGTATYEQDWEKALKKLAEPISIMAGFPYQGTKDIVKFIEEQD